MYDKSKYCDVLQYINFVSAPECLDIVLEAYIHRTYVPGMYHSQCAQIMELHHSCYIYSSV